MTNEEKAIDYATTECCNSCTSTCKKEKCAMFCNVRNAVLYGLTEGRKEGYEQGKNNERELQCGKKNYEKDIARLEEENKQLSDRLQEFSGCECCKSLYIKDKCRSCDDTLCNWEFEY